MTVKKLIKCWKAPRKSTKQTLQVVILKDEKILYNAKSIPEDKYLLKQKVKNFEIRSYRIQGIVEYLIEIKIKGEKYV